MSIKPLIPLAALLAMACTPVDPESDEEYGPPPPSAATPDAPDTGYRAGGNEPFWQLTFGEVSMDFSEMGAERTASAPIPVPGTTYGGGWIFAEMAGGQPFVVLIEREFCLDSMSARPFPHSVRVTANGQNFEGCGGDTVSLLTGPEWTVVAIDGTPTAASRKPTMTFDTEGRLTGNASCNRYTGPYEIAGDGGLQIGDAASTRMACVEPELSQQETRFLAALGGVDRFDLTPDGTIRFYATDRIVIEARR